MDRDRSPPRPVSAPPPPPPQPRQAADQSSEDDEDRLALGRGRQVSLEELLDGDGDEEDEEGEFLEEDEDDEEDEDEDEEDVPPAERQSFDTQLPARHSYLGESSELSGRTILEEDLLQEIVLYPHSHIVLMPGQQVPLTIFHPTQISCLQNLFQTTKTFGLVLVNDASGIEINHIGTTAEIYEYRMPAGENEAIDQRNELAHYSDVGLKLKIRGRQRFRIVNIRSQADGIRLGTVEILREKNLSDPLYHIRLKSRDKLRVFKDEEKEPFFEEEVSSNSDNGTDDNSDEGENSGGASSNRRRRRTSFNCFRPRPKKSGRFVKKTLLPYKSSERNYLRTRVYRAPLTPHPNWIYEMFDENILVERVHRLLSQLRMYSQSQQTCIPADPVDLSFWVATRLPIGNSDRLKVLALDSAVQRLRFEIDLLNKCQLICCAFCGVRISRQQDIFSMSQEGPQSAYVNAMGHVHETLTMHRAKNLHLKGSPSEEFSWFPGYAWTIAECINCGSHMGWKFTATNRGLRPKKFWGLTHNSLKRRSLGEQNQE